VAKDHLFQLVQFFRQPLLRRDHPARADKCSDDKDADIDGSRRALDTRHHDGAKTHCLVQLGSASVSLHTSSGLWSSNWRSRRAGGFSGATSWAIIVYLCLAAILHFGLQKMRLPCRGCPSVFKQCNFASRIHGKNRILGTVPVTSGRPGSRLASAGPRSRSALLIASAGLQSVTRSQSARRSKKRAVTAPKIKPPTWAAYATPPAGSCETAPRFTNCVKAHRPIRSAAGI
jgi:hypothetical protein